MTYKNISKTICQLTGYKLDVSVISRMLKGERQVPLSFAPIMAGLFPSKDAMGWKFATKEEVRQAFEQLPDKEVA